MEQNKSYISLFSCCIPVKGAKRSIIIDTQRYLFKFIPNDLYDIIMEFKINNIQKLFAKYGLSNKEILVEYFEFLTSNEFAFLTDTPGMFPEISKNWKSARTITNAIIDRDKNSNYDLMNAVKLLDSIGVEAIQIRLYDTIPFKKLVTFLTQILEVTERIKSLELIIKYASYCENSGFIQALIKIPLLSNVVIHSSPRTEKLDKDLWFGITFMEEIIADQNNCGCISPNYFSYSLEHVNESLNFNTCLNKKISIDTNGNIKNCPSMKSGFGKIDTADSLLQVVENEKFNRYWFIKKDDIKICRDCEFRYICSDCRAYVSNDFDKPIKCNYDPYQAMWM